MPTHFTLHFDSTAATHPQLRVVHREIIDRIVREGKKQQPVKAFVGGGKSGRSPNLNSFSLNLFLNGPKHRSPMQTAEPPANKYDALMDEINSRKAAVMNARSVPADHLGQYNNGDVTGLAASKLDEYRRNSGAMRTYNEAVSCDFACACVYLSCLWK